LKTSLALKELIPFQIFRSYVPAPVLLNTRDGSVRLIAGPSAGGGKAVGDLSCKRRKAGPEDYIHNPPVGTVAVAKRHFLGEYIKTLKGLRGKIADFRNT
jgi:hypothetical protein